MIKKQRNKSDFTKPTCLMCSNVGGAVRAISINDMQLKTKFKEDNIFWVHNICANFLQLNCSKKVKQNFFKIKLAI